MTRKNVLIIFGGCSSEYDVSLESAYAVIRGIDEEKYNPILLGITRDGKWFKYTGDIEKIPEDRWHEDKANLIPAFISPDRTKGELIEVRGSNIYGTHIDVAFPVLHGKNGEDGTVQGVIELAGIPLAGCGVSSSALCMDKYRAHIIAEHAGIRAPKQKILTQHIQKEIKEIVSDMKYPLFVKPLKAGSSFGISKIYGENELFEAVNEARKYDDNVVLEENIEGFEIGCAVLTADNEKLKRRYEKNIIIYEGESFIVGEVDEIELSSGFFDYTEKYTLKTSKIHMPARIDTALRDKIRNTSVKIYKALGCEGFARVDMFLTPSGKVVFNEINTIPGFTSHSRYPNMMKGAGIEFKELINMIIEEGRKGK